MFVDASALCAILLDEPDASDLLQRMSTVSLRLCSAMVVWETSIALARVRRMDPILASQDTSKLLAFMGIEIVPISAEIADLAIDAFARFGKGRHPAALNIGDCFAYACARHFGLPLLFKGEDFARTDIAAA